MGCTLGASSLLTARLRIKNALEHNVDRVVLFLAEVSQIVAPLRLRRSTAYKPLETDDAISGGELRPSNSPGNFFLGPSPNHQDFFAMIDGGLQLCVSRKGIPKDVREAYTRLYRSSAKAPLRITKAGGVPTAPKVWEELFKLPGSTSPSAAKVAWAEWCAEIDTRVATLRAASKGEGRPLTQVNALALAGKWYSWFLALNRPGFVPRAIFQFSHFKTHTVGKRGRIFQSINSLELLTE